ncbi:11S globulin seed storage protein 2 [Linum perenne]
MATKLATALLLLLSCLAAASAGLSQGRTQTPLSSRQLEYQFQAQQCNLDRISPVQPSFNLQSEGGVTQLWNQEEEQFICAGVAPFRDIIQPQSLSVPKFFPAPRLVYVQQGSGVLGLNFPGCPASYHSGQSQQQQLQRGSRRMMGGTQDEHQKIHRIREGDVIAIPSGVATWAYNDDSQDLIYVTFVDLNNDDNQLDQNLRGFLLAGGQSEAGQRRKSYQTGTRTTRGEGRQASFTPNIFQGFDEELIAESFNVPAETVRRMQSDNRGMIVRCQEEMRFVTEEEEQMQEMDRETENGVEETYCSMKIKHNLEKPLQADVFTRDAGKINIVNRDKLPILGYLDMSAERGTLMPDAMYTPHWSMSDHRVVYVIRGELQVQISDDKGNQIMNNRVQEGEMFVIPQFYATMGMGGNQGCEYLTFKTSGKPMKHQMAGYTSVMRAMPIDVIVNAFQMSPREAEQLKMNRDPETTLLSPIRGSSRVTTA